MHTEPIEFSKQYMDTTVGRVILNDVLPEADAVHQRPAEEEGPGQLVQYCYLKFGLQITVQMLDEVKKLGFLYATRAGISIGIDDMVVPEEKAELVSDAEKAGHRSAAAISGRRHHPVRALQQDHRNLVEGHRSGFRQDVQERWKRTTAPAAYLNPIYIMADSGARGSKQQIRQLSGMRGLMAKPSGEIIETPITANFREGLNVLQYFISTHGARKGLADTALKTADSGYLTRRLCDVAQDVIITEDDCGTADGIYVEPIIESGEIIEPLRDRIVGRVALEDQRDYESNVIVERESGDHRRPGERDSGGRYRARENPLRADLRIEARRLPALLRSQPGDRPHGRARRSGRHHLGAIHRRARHSADHAYVPHRRRGDSCQRAIDAGRQERRLRRSSATSTRSATTRAS